MPLYDFACPICGIIEASVKIGVEKTACQRCGSQMQRLFSPPKNIICDLEPYLDENIGHEPIYVKSKRHKRGLLKEKGLVMIG